MTDDGNVGRRTRPTWEQAFLASLSNNGLVATACLAAGVARSTVYERRSINAEFSQAWNDAQDHALGRAEAEALRRAIDGDRQPVLHNGKPVFVWKDEQGEIVPEGTLASRQLPLMRTSRSDLLLIFTLKALRPEKYRDQVSPVGGSVDDIDEEIRAAVRELETLVREQSSPHK